MAAFVVAAAGCTHSAITPEATDPAVPEAWVRGGDAGNVDLNWLESFDDPQLTGLVGEAITNNYLADFSCYRAIPVFRGRYFLTDERTLNRINR